VAEFFSHAAEDFVLDEGDGSALQTVGIFDPNEIAGIRVAGVFVGCAGRSHSD
jgi:hypothetical protein